MQRKFKIGIVGFGTVGTGVVKLLLQNKELLSKRCGCDLEIRYICDLDLTRSRGIQVPSSIKMTQDYKEVIFSSEVDVVVELVGGYDFAYKLLREALKNGKDVVTANKALLARYGKELFNLASSCKKTISFEASTGGGIPIIIAIREGLVANKIEKIMAILNGTCNYILTNIEKYNIPFEEALKEAQKKGYAEADPTFDIEGNDTVHKLCILSSLCFGGVISEENVYREGITHLQLQDINYINEMGYTIKLLGIAQQTSRGISLRVHPTILSKSHPLAAVDGVYNAIMVKGNFVGQTMFVGEGAGMHATASAVVSDIVNIARGSHKEMFDRMINMISMEKEPQIVNINEISSRYYFRIKVDDKPGVLSKITGIFGKYNISIAAVLQKEENKPDGVPVVIFSHLAKETDVKKAIKEIDALDVVKDKSVVIRVEA